MINQHIIIIKVIIEYWWICMNIQLFINLLKKCNILTPDIREHQILGYMPKTGSSIASVFGIGGGARWPYIGYRQNSLLAYKQQKPKKKKKKSKNKETSWVKYIGLLLGEKWGSVCPHAPPPPPDLTPIKKFLVNCTTILQNLTMSLSSYSQCELISNTKFSCKVHLFTLRELNLSLNDRTSGS